MGGVSRARVSFAALMVLGAAGCGDRVATPEAAPEKQQAPATLPIAADLASLHPPGTELAPGIEVQEGSWLVGTVFPLVDVAVRGDAVATGDVHGWQALLVIEGSPVEVWDRYAAAFDIHDRADAVHSCVAMQVGSQRPPMDVPDDTVLVERSERPPTRFLTEPRLDGEDRLRCEATLGGVSMALGHGVSRTPRSECAAERNCPHAAESHLLIRVDGTGGGDLVGYESLGTDELRYDRTREAQIAAGGSLNHAPPEEWIPVPEGALVAPELRVDTGQSRLPSPGERLDAGLDSFLGHGWVVPQGGASLVAPAELIDCNSGLAAVLSLDAEPPGAISKFDDPELNDFSGMITGGDDGEGPPWAAGYFASAGGHHLQAVAIASPGGSSTMLITECGD